MTAVTNPGEARNMLDAFLWPIQALFRWMDENPGWRLLVALGALAAAIALPLPGVVLDAWVVALVGSTMAMSFLLVVVGSELPPHEALAGLPAFLRRLAFHRLALALALTKAVLTGAATGGIMAWLAHGAFRGHVGVALAVVLGLGALRVVGARFPFGARLDQLVARLPFAARQEGPKAWGRLSEELRLLGDLKALSGLLRADAWAALACSAGLLAAGVATGMVVKGWPLALTLSTFGLLGLAEATLSMTPALLFGVALQQWMGGAIEAVQEEWDTPHYETEHDPAVGPPAVAVLEVGREVGLTVRRGFPDRAAVVRQRLRASVGYELPAIDVLVQAALPGRSFRISLRGGLYGLGDLPEERVLDVLERELERVSLAQAHQLLTLDGTAGLLRELATQSPILAAQAESRLGLPVVHGVLQGLLREQVPIVDLTGILEGLLQVELDPPSVPILVERLRQRMALTISQRHIDDLGVVHALELAPGWEALLAPGNLGLDGATRDREAQGELAAAVRRAVERLDAPTRPVLLVPRRFRPLVAEALRHGAPALAVLAPDEVAPRFGLRVAGRVELPEAVAPKATAPEVNPSPAVAAKAGKA